MIYKTATIKIYPNKEQQRRIDNILNTMRFIWNSYLAYINRHNYIFYMKFSVILNAYKKNKLLPDKEDYCQDYSWLHTEKIPAKAIKKELQYLDKAFVRFMKNPKTQGRPKFKGKNNPITSYYFVNDPTGSKVRFYEDGVNFIHIPNLKEVRIQHKDIYHNGKRLVPYESDIVSGLVIKENNKYYIRLIYKEKESPHIVLNNPIGIDLGIRTYATCYIKDKGIYEDKGFLHNKEYQKQETRIVMLQQILSKKVEMNYGKLLNTFLDKNKENPTENQQNKMKGKATRSNNIRRLYTKIHKCKIKQTNIAKDYINKLVHSIVITYPEYIAIEDLHVMDMVNNKKTKEDIYKKHEHHDHIQKSKWYYFKSHLINKCKEFSIHLHLVDPFYPSSQICSCCGERNKKIKLKDTLYKCKNKKCVNHTTPIGRDINASINICNTKEYVLVN